MNYRPYPDADRALTQAPVITSLAQLQAYVESGEFARRMLAIGETFSAVLARRSGKSAITAAIVDQPVKAGEHVHVAGRDGVRCAGREQACRLSPTPRLANDDEVTDAD